MPTVRAKKRRDKVPRLPSEDTGINSQPVYCANEACGKFICYQGIEVGIIHHKCHRCKEWTQFSNGDVEAIPPEKMRKVRCPQCGRFLYYEAVVMGFVKTKCRGCHTWHTLEITA